MSHSVGPYTLSDEPIEINAGRFRRTARVANRGDRAIQVGSHFHFFEVNRSLQFDRESTFGLRLDIPAGTAVRFEPGETRDVELVAIGGSRFITGLNGLTNGDLADPNIRATALTEVRRRGFGNVPAVPRQVETENRIGST